MISEILGYAGGKWHNSGTSAFVEVVIPGLGCIFAEEYCGPKSD